jgi:hypothetical protein
MARFGIKNQASIFLISAGVLGFEIALTRVFALAFWHHFAGLLIALALTGFGAAGTLSALFPIKPGRGTTTALILSGFGTGTIMLVSVHLGLAVGLNPMELAWSINAYFDLALLCLIIVVPFLVGAMHICLVLALSEQPGRDYALNLAGSALGCLMAAAILAAWTPNQALYPFAGFCVLAGLIHLPGMRSVIAGLAFTILLALVTWQNPLPLVFAPFKDRTATLAARGIDLEHRRTGLQGLVEIIGGDTYHFAPGLSLNCQAPMPRQKGIFIDGDLAGTITRHIKAEPYPEMIDCLLNVLPYEIIQPKSVLIVNPRGGMGILTALNRGAGKVAAVEENPDIYSLMRNELAGFSGNIFRDAPVVYHQADPANFLAHARQQFDLIILGNGVAWESASGGGVGVSRLVTDDALAAMLNRLTPSGAFAVSGPLLTPPRASLKLITTAVSALTLNGIDPSRSIAMVRDWNTVLLVVKPSGFSELDKNRIRSFSNIHGFDISILPGLRKSELNQYHQIPDETPAKVGALALNGKTGSLYKASVFDIRPATRDRPYFFQFFNFRTLKLILGPGDYRPLAATGWGLLFTWAGLLISLILAFIGSLLPLIRSRPPKRIGFFILIGLGYMIAEITLLSEIIYVIGRPALAVPLVVGVFLLVSGIGSRLWGRFPPAPFALGSAIALPLALLALRLPVAHPVYAGLVLAVPALVMGAPFAGGLTHLAGPDIGRRAWAFGVNGFFSVAGSLAASIICLTFGHMAAIITAGCCYFLAGVIAQGGWK